MPVSREEIASILYPQLGSLFIQVSNIDEEIASRLSSYSPLQQSLTELYDDLNRLLLLRIHRVTHGSLRVILDDHSVRLITTLILDDITDELMGVVFDKMAVFSSNYMRLHEYSMEKQSLSALKTLCLRFSSFYSAEEYQFLIRLIRMLYPEEKYRSWLPDQES